MMVAYKAKLGGTNVKNNERLKETAFQRQLIKLYFKI